MFLPEGKVRIEPQLFQKTAGSSAKRRLAGLKQPNFSWTHRGMRGAKLRPARGRDLHSEPPVPDPADLDFRETRPHPRKRGVQSVPR